MPILREIASFFRVSASHVLITSKSKRYTRLKEKAEILSTLTSLYLKSRFNGKTDQEITHRIFNFKVSAFGYSTLLYLFKEIFVQDEYYFKSSNPRPQIIDCGANIGMSILYFKYLYPDCSIIAFEPNPYAYELLKKNIAQNNITGVELVNLGLSNSDGSIEFYLGKSKGSLVGSIVPSKSDDKEVLVVPAGRISNYIGDKKFDLIKIDIEGAETEVLSNLVETDSIGKADRYIIEYHHRRKKAPSVLSDFIKPFEVNGFDYNIRSSAYSNEGNFQDIALYLYREKEQVAAMA